MIDRMNRYLRADVDSSTADHGLLAKVDEQFLKKADRWYSYK